MRLNKGSKKLRFILFSAWIFFCAVFGYFAPTIPFIRDIFSIKKVNVIGTDKFTREDIEKIFSRENWFFLDTDKVKNELKKYNFVKEVKIDRYFVGNINITVLERKPFAFLVYRGKKVMIDDTGKPLSLRYYNPKRFKNLPFIIYNDRSIKNDKFPKVRKIFETLKNYKFKKYIISKSQIACLSDTGRIFVFNIMDLDENLEKARVFLKKVSVNQYKYVDFSFDSMVVTRR